MHGPYTYNSYSHESPADDYSIRRDIAEVLHVEVSRNLWKTYERVDLDFILATGPFPVDPDKY